MAIDFDKYLYSTGTHYISNSGNDENGKYKDGQAGDQTGKEWQLKPWYNRPWTVVLRYPDQAVALEIAKLAIAAALNNKIGYDQNQRTTYWTQLQAVGYDPSKVVVAAEADCTSGVTADVKAAGFIFGIKALQNIPIDTYSGNMRSRFVNAGFVALTASKYTSGYDYLLPGDILLYDGHHAATNITLGKSDKDNWNPEGYATQHKPTDEPKEVNPPYVVVTGNSVFVRKGPSTDYAALGVVHGGDKLHYFGFAYPENGWLLVEYDDQTGWISGKYGKPET